MTAILIFLSILAILIFVPYFVGRKFLNSKDEEKDYGTIYMQWYIGLLLLISIFGILVICFIITKNII